MRRIIKREPTAFTEWKASRVGGPGSPGYTFSDIPGTVKTEIRTALYEEQGGIDAYTGESLRLSLKLPNRDDDGFHVEHMFPQSHCTAAEAVDYANMVACRPGRRDAPQHLPYGARYKDRKPWPKPSERPSFVRPTDAGCEGRFQYRRSGEMVSANPTDNAAQTTIEEMNLSGVTPGSRALRDNRSAAYKGTTANGKLSVRIARQRVGEIERRERDGLPLSEFVFVEKQALQRHIQRDQFIRANR